MRRHFPLYALMFSLILTVVATAPALAHRPYFEEEDIGPDEPWQVDDPTISTAIYATLESATDVDYFTFEGQAGQVILLALTIPQIEGQADFAPTLALMGPGLPKADLPDHVIRPEDAGALEIAPSLGPAPTFFEPFSRTSYWDRQEEHVTLPSDGRYVVAVWHPEGQVGRYVFVVGDKELPGGDPAFPFKMRDYWTPVGSSTGRTVAAVTALFWTVLGFLLGAMPFPFWLGRLLLRTDIRLYGDGAPSAVNAWRVGGWRVGLPAMLLDYLKGVVPVGLAYFQFGVSDWGLVAVTLAPVLGHAFSPFLRFRGGKAMVVTLGIWTGLTFGEGQIPLAILLGLFFLIQSVAAWAVILGMLGFLAYLLLRQVDAFTLAIWGGNMLILLWKHRHDLRQPIRPRPWVSNLVRRGLG
ncbi:MAG: glycerol-3-phosphate acyltransferase [Anaerolineae bacterium]|nr:glycerol-3-phosphate acyltransferase [Anaerolineae bacterium]